jgi:hypothetical protein
MAVIASARAVGVYGMNILVEGIQDSTINVAQFISPIFLYLRFILSGLPELRKAGLTHWLRRTRASEGGKKMMKKNVAY